MKVCGDKKWREFSLKQLFHIIYPKTVLDENLQVFSAVSCSDNQGWSHEQMPLSEHFVLKCTTMYFSTKQHISPNDKLYDSNLKTSHL